MLKLKREINKEEQILNLSEVLAALSICSVTTPIVEKALNNLTKLKDTEAHATYMVDNPDKQILRSLKINLTCEPEYLVDSDY